jgi:uncharacterized ferritin-like protein (DUF455 family)
VGAGARWVRYRCQEERVDPDQKFLKLVMQYIGHYPRGPFNHQARRKAGFSENEINVMESSIK